MMFWASLKTTKVKFQVILTFDQLPSKQRPMLVLNVKHFTCLKSL